MKTIFTLLLCMVVLFAKAQTAGTVTDEKQEALPGAVVKAYQNQNLIKTTLTNTSGQFRLDNVADYLIVSYTGYLPDTVKTPSNNIRIALKPDGKLLKEVAVRARQPVIRQETDRTVILVNDEVKKLAANVLQIIALSPGLTLSDNEDAILMSGKTEVQVLLNDKAVKLTARDLAKMLQAMPSSSVTAVEIMSNPPAKYEANGTTGLINIRTNAIQKGFNGNLDYSTSQSVYNWSDLSGLLNYGTRKLAISGYGGWHTGGYLTADDITRQLTNGTLNQQTSHLVKWSDPIFRVTVDYHLTPHSVIGGLIEREATINTATYATGSHITKPGQPDSGYLTNGRVPYVQHWNTYNLNYRYNDTTGNELTVDLDRATYARDNHTMVFTDGQAELVYHTITNIDINTLKTDYTHRWRNQAKLEAGFKLADVSTHDNQDGNLFYYHERINAAYLSLSKTYGKWAIQTGVRAERTTAKGVANPTAGGAVTRPDTSYLNLLPSFFLTYAPDEKNNFRLSFTRRVRRPDYDDLQPITYQVDPLNYTTGNPGLRVQRNDQLELSYTFDDRISFVGAYLHAADYFNPVIKQVGNVLYQTTGNAGVMNTLNFDLNYPVKVKKWWSMLYKLNVADDHFKGQEFQGLLDQGKWHYQVSTTQRFSLPGGYLLQLGARYTSASLNLIYYKQSDANTTASISRKFFKDQASLKVGVSDIFKTQRDYTNVNFGTLRYTDLGTFESRRVSFSLSWRFGNQKIRQTEDRERGDADEKNRGH